MNGRPEGDEAAQEAAAAELLVVFVGLSDEDEEPDELDDFDEDESDEDELDESEDFDDEPEESEEPEELDEPFADVTVLDDDDRLSVR